MINGAGRLMLAPSGQKRKGEVITHKQLLDKIVEQLVGICVGDLTTTESQIVRLLMDENFVTIAEGGEVERVK